MAMIQQSWTPAALMTAIELMDFRSLMATKHPEIPLHGCFLELPSSALIDHPVFACGAHLYQASD